MAISNLDIMNALQTLAPGAQWSFSGNDLTTLQWMDKVIAQPTNAAILSVIQTNQTAALARVAQKQQARLDVKNVVLTASQRFQALLTILDLDL